MSKLRTIGAKAAGAKQAPRSVRFSRRRVNQESLEDLLTRAIDLYSFNTEAALALANEITRSENKPENEVEILSLLRDPGMNAQKRNDLNTLLWPYVGQYESPMPFPVMSEAEIADLAKYIYPKDMSPAFIVELVDLLAVKGYPTVQQIIENAQVEPGDLRLTDLMLSPLLNPFWEEVEQENDIFLNKIKVRKGMFSCPSCQSRYYTIEERKTSRPDEENPPRAICSNCSYAFRV